MNHTLQRLCIVLLLFLGMSLGLIRSAYADPGWEDRGGKPSEICRKIAMANLMDAETGWIRPGPEYLDGTWLRDSFWVTGNLGHEIGRRALSQFGTRLDAKGQAPTRVNAKGVADQYFDDESTMLYMIWAERDGGQPRERLVKAWDWLSSHVSSDGFYWTPPGSGHSWHDTLNFPDWDVSSYNQGLYAVAAMSAVRLGVGYPGQAERAMLAYRQLYRSQLGYVPVSLRLDYHDVSVVVGEVLARTYFDRKLLPDRMVQDTVRAMSSADFAPLGNTGLKVLSRADGGYLPDCAFMPYSIEGRYHNGGSWLLYDTFAWTALGLSGDETGFKQARLRVRLETYAGTYYEYVSTGPARQYDILPAHADYGWNAFVAKLVSDQ